MMVYHDKDFEEYLQGTPRDHPWLAAESNLANRYVDFRSEPYRIEESLEDFKAYSEQAATQRFYALVRWINGDQSVLESNDCAFRGPYPNDQPEFDRKLAVFGRVSIFFRQLALNTKPAAIDWLCDSLQEQVKKEEAGFRYGCVSYARWPHGFTALMNTLLPADGDIVALRFWAWGNDDVEVFENLDRLFRGLHSALGAISDHARKGGAGT